MRRIAWFILLCAATYVSVEFLHSAYTKYSSADPASHGLFDGRQGWLYTHLIGGALTIILGPLQLLRQRLAAVRPIHRWTGRVYLLGMLVACAGAAGLITTSPAPGEIRIAFAATMLAWLATAATALSAVLRKRMATHRDWMIRNYLVTLAPVTFRLLLPMALALGFVPSPTLIATLLWISWSLPLLIFEMLLRLPGIRLFAGTGPSQLARGSSGA